VKRFSNGVWTGLGVLGFLVLVSFSLANQGRSLTQPAAQVKGIQSEATAFNPAQHKGRVLVVNFMAEWCTGCFEELPEFVRLYQKFKDRGLAMVGISVQSSREGTLQIMRQFDIPYPVYLDPQGKVAAGQYRLTGMPSTFIYDRSGKLVKSIRGVVSDQVLKATVEGLL
jgi:peroxiredoxin